LRIADGNSSQRLAPPNTKNNADLQLMLMAAFLVAYGCSQCLPKNPSAII